MFLKRFGGTLFYIVLTLLLSAYVLDISNLSREELRGVPLGPPMLALGVSIVWTFFSVIAMLYLLLRANVHFKAFKVSIFAICILMFWLLPWLWTY